MPRASIRLRLTAWHSALLMATIAGLGFAAWMLMARAMTRRVDGMLDFEFEEAAERLSSGNPAAGLADAPAAFHDVYLFRLLTPDGKILAESPALAGFPPPPTAGTGPEGAKAHANASIGTFGPCRIVIGPVGLEGNRCILQIATPLREHEREMVELRGVLLTILPAGLIASTLGGYWLAGRALSPVGRMTEAARRISAASLDERLAVETGDDELGLLAETLNAMLDRIDRAFAAMRRFTSDAAHELKTPLTSIRTEAEVALATTRPPEDYRETLLSVVEETERLARLADRLLILSIEESGAILPRCNFRLDEAARDAVRQALEAASRAGVSLRIADLVPMVIDGDRDLFRQVLDNLIENAVKYSKAGGVVDIRVLSVDDKAIVEVADDGVGIPPEALPRVFDRFYRVDPSRSRRTGGTGLGLSIAKAVVERHGGTIQVTSEFGQGSTFRVILPIAARTMIRDAGPAGAPSFFSSVPVRKN